MFFLNSISVFYIYACLYMGGDHQLLCQVKTEFYWSQEQKSLNVAQYWQDGYGENFG